MSELKYLYYSCKTSHVNALTHVSVLEESLLRVLRLLLVDAQLEVLVHDLLDELLREVVVALLGFDDIKEGVQGLCRLP